MENSRVKIAIRHTLVTLAWVGLLLLSRQAMAADGDWQGSQTIPSNQLEVVPPGEKGSSPPPASLPDSDQSVVGEHQMPIGGVFGDTPPAACEFCGGGGCLPPTWSVESSLAVMAMSRPADQRLGANSLPAGPLPAGSISVTNSLGITTSNVYSQYLNDAVQQSVLETHTPAISNSPAWGLTINRFLGRDGEERDHFLEFDFNGLQNYSSAMTVHGAIVPFYNTTPFPQTIPATPPVAEYFDGSLVSPAPIYLPINGNQQELIQPNFSILGQNYDKAFNRSDTMSTSYVSSYNEFELDYRFAGHNQPDQLVMNPNGHWYRECQTGYYYSYFFGLKGMVIDEQFQFLSSGSQYAAVANADGTFSPGALQYTHQGSYRIHTYNTLVGFQSGGKLEYRFCRWCIDTHGCAGMFLNFARQDSRIQTSFGGPTPPTLSDGSIAQDTDNSFGDSTTDVAFAGGFGIAGSYKFRPNVVAHISYDMLWIGDIARAPEQLILSAVPETTRDLINTQGSVFYDGVKFGLEVDW